MKTSDWAEEAYHWFQSYHQAIADGSFDPSQFFSDLVVDDVLLHTIDQHPLLGLVDLLQWETHHFSLFEQVRGWQPILRQLPKVKNYRLLTLIRRDLTLPLEEPSNQALVSRHQWTLLEGLRWRKGLYDRADVQDVIQKGLQQQSGDNHASSAFDPSGLQLEHADDKKGRFLSWKSTDVAQPGQIIWEAQPFASSLYQPENITSCTHCFHCMAPVPETNAVRELTLLCPDCQIWSYCSLTCRQEKSVLHQKECAHLRRLIEKSHTLDLPPYKSILVYRAALQTDHRQWSSLLELESHLEEHRHANVPYLDQVSRMAEWMIDNDLLSDPAVTVDNLVHLFLAINVNAISLGPEGVGLFPGTPSMFNHSCTENTTHSWDKGGILRFRAVEDIQQDQECCISYVSHLELATAERTAPLAAYKFFTCECLRCQSESEGGRSEATKEWKQCLQTLEEGTNDAMGVYRRLVLLAEILFPAFFITKGWALEECAHALIQDTRCRGEAMDFLKKAREQYVVCRGEASPLVRRVDQAVAEWTPQERIAPSIFEENLQETEDENADLILAEGWCPVLLEVKTFESTEWAVLADRIQAHWPDDSIVRWNKGYRLYDVGFSLQTLIMSCVIQESIDTKEQVAEDIQEAFEDEIQHVDLLLGQDYSY